MDPDLLRIPRTAPIDYGGESYPRTCMLLIRKSHSSLSVINCSLKWIDRYFKNPPYANLPSFSIVIFFKNTPFCCIGWNRELCIRMLGGSLIWSTSCLCWPTGLAAFTICCQNRKAFSRIGPIRIRKVISQR